MKLTAYLQQRVDLAGKLVMINGVVQRLPEDQGPQEVDLLTVSNMVTQGAQQLAALKAMVEELQAVLDAYDVDLGDEVEVATEEGC